MKLFQWRSAMLVALTSFALAAYAGAKEPSSSGQSSSSSSQNSASSNSGQGQSQPSSNNTNNSNDQGQTQTSNNNQGQSQASSSNNNSNNSSNARNTNSSTNRDAKSTQDQTNQNRDDRSTSNSTSRDNSSSNSRDRDDRNSARSDRDDRSNTRDRSNSNYERNDNRNADNRSSRSDRESSRDSSSRRGNMRGPDIGIWFNRSSRDSLVISDVSNRGPIAKLGFREGDRIVSVNGRRVSREDEFLDYLLHGNANRVTVIVVRDNREETIYVEPAVLTGEYETTEVDPMERFGIILDDRYDDRIVVWRVIPRSPAYYAGFRPGDVVVNFGGHPYRTRTEFERGSRDWKAGDANVQIRRGDRTRDLSVEIPNADRRTGERSVIQGERTAERDTTPSDQSNTNRSDRNTNDRSNNNSNNNRGGILNGIGRGRGSR